MSIIIVIIARAFGLTFYTGYIFYGLSVAGYRLATLERKMSMARLRQFFEHIRDKAAVVPNSASVHPVEGNLHHEW